jgi:undecaprenyl diphosphate synthase
MAGDGLPYLHGHAADMSLSSLAPYCLSVGSLLLVALYMIRPTVVLYMIYYGWKRPFQIIETFVRSRRRRRALPKHIGFIMDGNRRYARRLAMTSASFGHELGAQTVKNVLEWCLHWKIHELTLWALSTDNLKRPSNELERIWALCKIHLDEIANSDVVQQNRVVLRVVGERSLIPKDVLACIAHAESKTRAYEPQYVLNIGIAYGGREELAHMAQTVLEQRVKSHDTSCNISVDELAKHAYTSSDVDLIVRTGGEVRLSGFMLWQSKHAELWFADVLWPAFGYVHLLRALDAFHVRQRRYGL